MFDIFKDNISIDDALPLIESGDVVVLDVRTGDEYKEGHIKGSINIDVRDKSFIEKIDPMDKDKEYIVHCGGGERAKKGCSIMRDIGFSNTRVLKGGMRGWKEKGLPKS